jgi:hypothetical protein
MSGALVRDAPGPRPTGEQQQAIDLFLTGDDLKIHAFAGAGKTATLRFLARATGRRGIYLAFNRAIAQEAGAKFPPGITTKTLHAYAYRSLPPLFRERAEKLTGTLSIAGIVAVLKLDALEAAPGCRLPPRAVAAAVRTTVRRFCQSAADRPETSHVPRPGAAAGLSWWRYRAHARAVVELATRLWERMSDPRSDTPLGHDGYLKLWALARPELPADYVLLDEAQDSSEVVVALLGRQSCQVVVVGDRHQQIYAWRGAPRGGSGPGCGWPTTSHPPEDAEPAGRPETKKTSGSSTSR